MLASAFCSGRICGKEEVSAPRQPTTEGVSRVVLDAAVPYRRKRQVNSVRSWGALGVLPVTLAFVASLSWMAYSYTARQISPLERLPQCMLLMMGATILAVVIMASMSRGEQRVEDKEENRPGSSWERRIHRGMRQDSLKLDLLSTTLVSIELSCLLDIVAITADTFIRNLDPAATLARTLIAAFAIVMTMAAAAAVTEIIRRRNAEFRDLRKHYRQSVAQANNPWQRSLDVPVKTVDEIHREQIASVVGDGPKYPDVPIIDANGNERLTDSDDAKQRPDARIPEILTHENIAETLPSLFEESDDASETSSASEEEAEEMSNAVTQADENEDADEEENKDADENAAEEENEDADENAAEEENEDADRDRADHANGESATSAVKDTTENAAEDAVEETSENIAENISESMVAMIASGENDVESEPAVNDAEGNDDDMNDADAETPVSAMESAKGDAASAENQGDGDVTGDSQRQNSVSAQSVESVSEKNPEGTEQEDDIRLDKQMTHETIASALDAASQRSDSTRKHIDRVVATSKERIADTAREVGRVARKAGTSMRDFSAKVASSSAAGLATAVRGIRKLLSEMSQWCLQMLARCQKGLSAVRKRWVLASDTVDAEYENINNANDDSDPSEEGNSDLPETR